MAIDMDWDSLDFSLHPTKVMYVARCEKGQSWQQGKLKPFAPIPISPAAGILNYGQGVFEGMKAFRRLDDSIALFRPKKNAQRLAQSAIDLCIPPVPEPQFLQAVQAVVEANSDYVAPVGKGSLYLRPMIIGDGAQLGCKPAPHYQFIIFASPVGNYFKGDLQAISLTTRYDYFRASPNGTGHAKYAGNYAGAYRSTLQAQAQGFQACLYLDAKEARFIEEAGTANMFFVKGNTLLTPELGSILPGITRESIMHIAKDQLGMDVIERKIAIDEISNFDECFCTGTAAIITPISHIENKGQTTCFNQAVVGNITKTLYDIYTGIQLGNKEDAYQWITTAMPSSTSLV